MGTFKKHPSTIIIAASGTGGHVFPGIAIAEALMQRVSHVRVLFAGTKQGPEAEILARGGWQLACIGDTSIHSGGFMNRLRTYGSVPLAILRCRRLIHREHPDVVLGIGGFTAGPMLLAASCAGVPTALVEPNAIAGRTNLKLARFARKVFVGFDRTATQFPRAKAVVTGNPVRGVLAHVARKNYDGTRPLTVLCYGGSQGAKRLNELMIEAVKMLEGYETRLRFIHQVGNYTPVEEIAEVYRYGGFESEVFKFSDRMADLYAEADVALARAGAGTVAELIAVRLPAVLVPFPYAVDDHQTANAEEMVRLGGALMSQECALTGEALATMLKDFVEHPARLNAMSAALARSAHGDAADRIAEECLKMIA